jgi:hypothetical protein
MRDQIVVIGLVTAPFLPCQTRRRMAHNLLKSPYACG